MTTATRIKILTSHNNYRALCRESRELPLTSLNEVITQQDVIIIEGNELTFPRSIFLSFPRLTLTGSLYLLIVFAFLSSMHFWCLHFKTRKRRGYFHFRFSLFFSTRKELEKYFWSINLIWCRVRLYQSCCDCNFAWIDFSVCWSKGLSGERNGKKEMEGEFVYPLLCFPSTFCPPAIFSHSCLTPGSNK